MTYTVHLRKNDTGEVRAYTLESCNWRDADGRDSSFIWRDGNFSCDCNRRLFFYYAAGQDEPEGEDEIECGNGEFDVVRIETPEGDVADVSEFNFRPEPGTEREEAPVRQIGPWTVFGSFTMGGLSE